MHSSSGLLPFRVSSLRFYFESASLDEYFYPSRQSRLKPKSMILMPISSLFWEIRTFYSFTSRWEIPFSCKYKKASKTFLMILRAIAYGNLGFSLALIVVGSLVSYFCSEALTFCFLIKSSSEMLSNSSITK